MNVYMFLAIVTVFYAGYNLLIKVSGAHVPDTATSTILATICLQLAALSTSAIFAAILLARGDHSLVLPPSAFMWAAAAGVCIGIAEIAYFYVFGGLGGGVALPSNVAIPTIVCGTIVITAVVSFFIFNEPLTRRQFLGTVVVGVGIFMIFWPDASAKG